MKKTAFMLFLALILLASFIQAPAFGQDDKAAPAPAAPVTAAPETPLTDSEFTYGTVVSVSAGNMKISEYDFETDTSEEVTYDVAQDVKMENVKSIGDVREGDEVEIEYLVKGGKRTAVSIYVE